MIIDNYLKVFLLLFVVCFALFLVLEGQHTGRRNAELQAQLGRLAEFNHRFISNIDPEDTGLWQRYLDELDEADKSRVWVKEYYYNACEKMNAE